MRYSRVVGEDPRALRGRERDPYFMGMFSSEEDCVTSAIVDYGIGICDLWLK
jgi:hypothetical protein